MKKIKLTMGQFALLDDADYEWINRWKWRAKKTQDGSYCAVRTGARPKREAIYMHREIMSVSGDVEIDHRDGNGLNNQRHNLRECSHSQNMFNRRKEKDNKTGYKGVRLTKGGRFQAIIAANRIAYCLGNHATAEEAARAYDEKAKVLHGVFARLNFPQNL